MATLVAKTIGTGGDYTTLQAWEDACPASLVTADQIWQGRVKNQVFSGTTAMLTISGTAVDSTRYVELTTDTGCSFLDNANSRTNALRYNEANGAAIKATGAWSGNVVIISQAYTRINKLQISSTSNSGFAIAQSASTYVDVDKCILESTGSAGVINLYGAGNAIRNSLVVQRKATSATSIAKIESNAAAYNTTFVSTASVATNGITGAYGNNVIENCYVGNVTNVTSGSSVFTKSTSFTSVSGPPSGWSAAPFSTATFESITNGTHDFRLAAGSSLIDVGTTDATYAANDITGLVRAGTWDVGAWEAASGGAVTHDASGALTAATASVSGASTHTAAIVTHTASGSLTASASTITGASTRTGGFTTHGSSGALSSAAASVAGAAAHATAAVTHTAIGSLSAAQAVISGSSTHSAPGILTTDVLTNNTGTPLTNTAVAWSWLPIGRIGALAAITPIDGTGTTNASGALTVAGLSSGAGILLVAVLDSGPTTDAVFYQAGTVA